MKGGGWEVICGWLGMRGAGGGDRSWWVKSERWKVEGGR